MPDRPPGARWFAGWVRARRRQLGLSRRELAARAARRDASVSATLVADIEIGDRLPTLQRAAALARAIDEPVWAVAERVRLAPHLELGAVGLEPLGETLEDLDLAHRALASRDWLTAAAAADRVERSSTGSTAHRAALVLATALGPIGSAALAAHFAWQVLDRSSSRLARATAWKLLASSAYDLHQERLAGYFRERAGAAKRGADGLE